MTRVLTRPDTHEGGIMRQVIGRVLLGAAVGGLAWWSGYAAGWAHGHRAGRAATWREVNGLIGAGWRVADDEGYEVAAFDADA